MSESWIGGFKGGKLIVAVVLWVVIVLVGLACVLYGFLNSSGPGAEGEEQSAATALPAATITPFVPSAATSVPAQPTALPITPQATEEVFGYGIAANAYLNTEYTVEQVRSLGMGWIKQQVKWSAMEGNPGQIDWSGSTNGVSLDAAVAAANAKGLKVMLSVVDAPLWSRTYFDGNIEGAPPDDLNAFANFLGQLVDRYHGRIHAIEVWNEENLDREWDTAGGVNPEEYVAMLQIAYQTIKSHDPSIMVISGALSPTGGQGTDPANPQRVIWMDDFEYFQRMVSAGFLNYCDCVGAHHNGYNMAPSIAWDQGFNDPTAAFRGPFDNPHHSWSFKSTLWGYHDMMVSATGTAKPLCVTEFGWATSEGFDGYPPGFEFALDNTLAEQAQWNVEAFQLMREWGIVRLAFLWNLDYSQKGWGPQDPNAPYALIDFQGIGRPSFYAIQGMEKP